MEPGHGAWSHYDPWVRVTHVTIVTSTEVVSRVTNGSFWDHWLFAQSFEKWSLYPRRPTLIFSYYLDTMILRSRILRYLLRWMCFISLLYNVRYVSYWSHLYKSGKVVLRASFLLYIIFELNSIQFFPVTYVINQTNKNQFLEINLGLLFKQNILRAPFLTIRGFRWFYFW